MPRIGVTTGSSSFPKQCPRCGERFYYATAFKSHKRACQAVGAEPSESISFTPTPNQGLHYNSLIMFGNNFF